MRKEALCAGKKSGIMTLWKPSVHGCNKVGKTFRKTKLKPIIHHGERDFDAKGLWKKLCELCIRNELLLRLMAGPL